VISKLRPEMADEALSHRTETHLGKETQKQNRVKIAHIHNEERLGNSSPNRKFIALG
jgi:hypothetical protein